MTNLGMDSKSRLVGFFDISSDALSLFTSYACKISKLPKITIRFSKYYSNKNLLSDVSKELF
jgi:hypothetical protein